MTSKTEAAATGSQQRVAAPFGWRTVTPLVMGSALNPINSSVIATALVPIAAAMHVPVGRTSILVSSVTPTSTPSSPRKSCPRRRTSSPSPTSPA